MPNGTPVATVAATHSDNPTTLIARLRNFISYLGEAFWVIPALAVLLGVLGGVAAVSLDESSLVPQWLIDNSWVYNGGGTGARTLLGTIASSTIGVAGTVFSITIAALSIAAGQMGPRLMRNFTRDRGNQITLGVFLGSFSYALMVLRSVRTIDEGMFVPHMALTFAIVLALLCVATLVYFVGHMAGRINVETVVNLVGVDLGTVIENLTSEEPQPAPPVEGFWQHAVPVTDQRRGYLQNLDADGLADWAAEHRTALRLMVRPGDYVFPGGAIAFIKPPVAGVQEAIRNATALGAARISSEDLEFAVRQLVEVAVRALSPGINDPHTAVGVLDRLGAALCDVAKVHLPTGVTLRDGHAVLVIPSFEYDGLVDAMFHMIRQNASTSPAVLIHMLEVLTAVVGCEQRASRIETLQRHADLVLGDAERDVRTPSDLLSVRHRHGHFERVRRLGSIALCGDGVA